MLPGGPPLPRHVGQQRHLAGTLHRRRDLHLVAAAGAGDAARADLALLRDVAPELVVVLVVDLLDLLLAEVTALPPDRPRRGRRALASGLVAILQLCQVRASLERNAVFGAERDE